MRKFWDTVISVIFDYVLPIITVTIAGAAIANIITVILMLVIAAIDFCQQI